MTEKTFQKYKNVVDEYFKLGLKSGALAWKNIYGSSLKASKVNFSNMMKKTVVIEYVKDKHALVAKNSSLEIEAVVRLLENYAKVSVYDFAKYEAVEKQRIIYKKDKDKDGKEIDVPVVEFYTEMELVFIDWNFIDEWKIACVKSVKMGRHGMEIIFHDQLQAIDMLMKMHGKYKADNQQKKAVINITASNAEHQNIIQNIIQGS